MQLEIKAPRPSIAELFEQMWGVRPDDIDEGVLWLMAERTVVRTELRARRLISYFGRPGDARRIDRLVKAALRYRKQRNDLERRAMEYRAEREDARDATDNERMRADKLLARVTELLDLQAESERVHTLYVASSKAANRYAAECFDLRKERDASNLKCAQLELELENFRRMDEIRRVASERTANREQAKK